jgi:pimeloyl-ACP methyl ester carboxylesterase
VLVEIPDAGHDVHLDQPGEWRAALTRFLRSLATSG